MTSLFICDDVIAVIEMDDVPLPDALRQIARKAHLNVLLDPRLSASPYDRTMVSFRWQNVTAKEALTALLENHGLVLVETSRPLQSSADRTGSR